MTASQEQIECQSRGYMLVYRSFNNIIFGALGYQLNPIHVIVVVKVLNANVFVVDVVLVNVAFAVKIVVKVVVVVLEVVV